MTFRPSAKERLLYAGLGLACGVILSLMAASFVQKPGPGKQFAAYKLGGMAVLFGFAVYLNWLSWTSRVSLDASGIHWREGRTSGSIAWDDLQGWGWKRSGKYLRAGLVKKSGPQVLMLPFVTPELYGAIRPRGAPLPPEIEKELKLGG